MYHIHIYENRLMLERKVNIWKGTLENGGLKMNVSKIEYMACGSPGSSTILISPEPAVRSENFSFLGSVMPESGSIDHDVHGQISAAWAKWREVTGIVCDRKIPPKLKGLIQEHHSTGSFIRQRILASTISAHSGASRHGN